MSCVIPPIATRGREVSARTVFSCSSPVTGLGFSFRPRGKDGTERHVIHRFAGRCGHLCGTVCGKTDDSPGSHYPAGVGWGQVFLSDMQPRAQHLCVIGAVIDDKQGARLPAQPRDLFCHSEDFGTPETFMAELQNSDTGFEECFGGGQVVGNWINTCTEGPKTHGICLNVLAEGHLPAVWQDLSRAIDQTVRITQNGCIHIMSNLDDPFPELYPDSIDLMTTINP